ncbi:class I SAM-dependent methyltransferase [Porphyrobacter sp. AAP60]|uniref:class I SAM-dependent methyltransferase n=1 Tax=Porphyrobacter sp. AAP60 TaxID=1523423 RepID=UPI0012E168D0|nr:class I SAM-dependent methyltransferase [Porphyrobacter sp. AAP60]
MPNFKKALLSAARSIYRLAHPKNRELARIRRSNLEQFQPFTTTKMNRYPMLFRIVSEQLADKVPQRILSFGCSSGEEVRSLRAYCPHAFITGVDCNRRVLEKAQSADPCELSTYIEGDRPKPNERYDLILALAVFRHGDLRGEEIFENCEAKLSFERVNAAVTRLGAVLTIGGWLAWGNNHFRFEDMDAAQKYCGALVAGRPTMPDPLSGSNNRLIETSPRPPLLVQKVV